MFSVDSEGDTVSVSESQFQYAFLSVTIFLSCLMNVFLFAPIIIALWFFSQSLHHAARVELIRLVLSNRASSTKENLYGKVILIKENLYGKVILMNNLISNSSYLLTVHIIKKTILEMTVMEKISCMLNYIIDWFF